MKKQKWGSIDMYALNHADRVAKLKILGRYYENIKITK